MFSNSQQMLLKYTCERNVELHRRQMAKYEEVLSEVSDIKKNQTMKILPHINSMLGQFGLLKQTVESSCEAIHEQQPREWGMV
jgi:ACT domain-containing protein